MSETSARVFVVDDDPSVRTALKRLLASSGLTCETFGTAAEFLKRLEEGATGCVLLDIRMPDLSGLELQQILQENQQTLPIIIVTASTGVSLHTPAIARGRWIVQPIGREKLKAING